MKESFSKKLIKYLCEYYKYELNEFINKQVGTEFWALKSKEETKFNYLIFSYKEQWSYMDNAEGTNFGYVKENKTNIVKILILENKKQFNTYEGNLNEDNLIILDAMESKVLFSTEGTEDIVLKLKSIMDYMIKVRDNNATKVSIITYSIIAVNIIMYIISAYLSNTPYLSKYPFENNIDVLNMLGAKNNFLISNGEYYRFFTAMFLHGGLLHVSVNMYSLYSIGPVVERFYGRYKYIIIYLICGIISSVFSYLFSSAVSIGASGAIFGLLGVILVFSFKMKNIIGKGFLINIISVVAINGVIGLTLPNIDNFAHLGGLLSGIVLGLIFKVKVGTL